MLSNAKHQVVELILPTQSAFVLTQASFVLMQATSFRNRILRVAQDDRLR